MKIRNKIDLHLHIDGSARPETVNELAKKYNIEPECSMTLEEIRNSMVIAEGEYDPDFLTFEAPIRAMQNEEGLYRITKELVETLDEQGLIYAELRFAPQYHTQKGLNQKQAVEAAISGLQDGLKNAKQLKAQLILCAMNHCDPAHNHSENLETVHLVKEYLHKGVCALDLAGYEERMPEYKDLFDLAHKLNIPCTTHSEFTVKDALTYNTTRIGHGYQTALIEELSNEVIRKKVTLEMCPDSSLSYEYGLTGDTTHPLAVLFKKGAKVTINTDNMTVLDTTLEKEYELVRKMGLSDEDIIQMNNYAIEASFLSDEEKVQLLQIHKI